MALVKGYRLTKKPVAQEDIPADVQVTYLRYLAEQKIFGMAS